MVLQLHADELTKPWLNKLYFLLSIWSRLAWLIVRWSSVRALWRVLFWVVELRACAERHGHAWVFCADVDVVVILNCIFFNKSQTRKSEVKSIVIIIIEGLSLLQSIPPTTANKQTQAQKKRGCMARKLLGANAKSYRLKLKLKLSRLVKSIVNT